MLEKYRLRSLYDKINGLSNEKIKELTKELKKDTKKEKVEDKKGKKDAK